MLGSEKLWEGSIYGIHSVLLSFHNFSLPSVKHKYKYIYAFMSSVAPRQGYTAICLLKCVDTELTLAEAVDKYEPSLVSLYTILHTSLLAKFLYFPYPNKN